MVVLVIHSKYFNKSLTCFNNPVKLLEINSMSKISHEVELDNVRIGWREHKDGNSL